MRGFAKLRRFVRDDETRFIELTRHFFKRFFDTELISKNADAHLGVAHILAMLPIPGVAYALFAFFVYSYIYWHFTQALYDAVSTADQCRYVLFSMAVIGLVAVLEWDALFPDARDYAILTPLPLKLRTIFGAKVVALLMFLGLFVVAVAGIPVVFYPLMAVWGLRPDATFGHFAMMIVAHGVAVFSGCLFTFLFFVALQGVLINLLTARQFRKMSVYVQAVATVVIVCLFFLLPVIPALLTRWETSRIRLLFALPPMWFLGLYRVLLGSPSALWLSLARIAILAFALSIVVSIAAYWLCYKRQSQMALESPGTQAKWRFGAGVLAGRIIDRLALSEGRERATFYFVLKTLSRSAKHRLYFVAYVSVGLGLVLIGIFEMAVRSTHGNLWAAFDRPGEALLSVPLVVSFFTLSGMRIVFGYPAELKGNWIFQITDEGDGRKYLAGVRKAMIAVAVAPVFAVTFVPDALLWGVPVALLTVLFGVLLSLILMEILLYAFHKIPFTCSHLPGKANLPALGVVYWLAFTLYAYSAASLERWMLHHPAAWIIAVAADIVVLQRLIARRNRALARGFSFEYEDPPWPAVQSLGLNG